MNIQEQQNCELEYWKKNIMPKTSYINLDNNFTNKNLPNLSDKAMNKDYKKEGVR